MASTNINTNAVDPTAPPIEEVISPGTMANFEAILKIRILQWKEEQRLLTIGRIATPDEKEKLTLETDPIGKELGNTILRHLEKGNIIKPFLRGSDVDFHIWKDDLHNNLAIIGGTDYAHDIADEQCVKMINNFIPTDSTAHRYLCMVLPQFTDEAQKIKVGTRFSQILDAILVRMRTSRTKSKMQMLSKKPFWDKNKDNVERFIRRYETYLQHRLDIQAVAPYLDNNEVLRRAEFLNFFDAIPPIIRKEVRPDVITINNWAEFTNEFIEAEVSVAYNNPNYRMHKDHKYDDLAKKFNSLSISNNNNTHKNNNFRKHNNNGKQFHKNNRQYNHKFNKNGNNNHNKNNNFRNNYNKNNGNKHGNGGNRNFNNAKGNNNNYKQNNTHKQRDNYKGSTNKNGDNRNKYNNNNTGKHQVNSIDNDSFAESVAHKLHEHLMTLKYNTMIIMACIMIILLPVTGAVIPPSYEVEPCDQPMIPAFYALKSYDTASAVAASLRIISPDCTPPGPFNKIGIEMHNILVLEGPGMKLSEIVYISSSITLCDIPNLIQDTKGNIYERKITTPPFTESSARRFVDIANAYKAKCPETTIVSDDDQGTSDTETRTATQLNADSFVLPDFHDKEHKYDKRTKGELYVEKVSKLWHNFQLYAKGLEAERDDAREKFIQIDTLLRKSNQQTSKLRETLDNIKTELENQKQMVNNLNNQLKDTIKLSKHTKIVEEKDRAIADDATARDNFKKQLDKCNREKDSLSTELSKEQGKLATCLNEKLTLQGLIDEKDKHIQDLDTRIREMPPSFSNEALDNCLKEKSKAAEECIKEKGEIQNICNDEKAEQNKVIEKYQIGMKNQNKKITEINYNIQTIVNSIHAIQRVPQGTACIYKEALVERLNTVYKTLNTNSELEYIVPEQDNSILHDITENIKVTTKDTYKSITEQLGNAVKNINIEGKGPDYESFLSFLIGVFSAIAGRIAKEKIGGKISNIIAHRRIPSSNSHNDPFGRGGSGVPLVHTRAINNHARQNGILVSRDSTESIPVNIIEENKTKLPTVSLYINNIKHTALIDTGAAINIISKNALQNIKTNILKTDVIAISASGYKTVQKIGIENLPPDKNKVNDKTSKIFTSEEIEIKPNSCVIFHTQIKNNNMNGTDVLVEVNNYWKQSNHLLTMEQLCTIHNNTIPITVVNTGNNPVIIAKDTYIGDIYAIEEIDENKIRVYSEEVIPEDADWEAFLPPYPSSQAPLQKDEFQKLIGESKLSPEGHKRLLDILWKNRKAFHEYDGKSGLYSGKQRLKIDLKNPNEVPRRIKASRMSKEKEDEISKQIADMIKNEMIEPSRSPYLSRVVLVRKKDQQWRFVVDFRYTNTLVKQQSHIIPRIDRITEEAAGKRFYTSFDLKAGFHQIPLDENSRQIAAFITHKGIFQYKVMPMGLTGSPDKFQEIMDEVLEGIPDCYVYLDDILTCSNDENSHLNSIDDILGRIIKFEMKISLAKCQFGQTHVKYLGFHLDESGIHANPEKVKSIKDKPIPRTAKELKCFLGAISYFRKHIKNFAAMAAPLYSLDKNFQWEQKHTDAFEKLKTALIEAAVLSPPDNTKNYTIFTDASFQGLGAALTQNGKPVAFTSRSLKPAEKNYPIIKLEALALVYALRQFRPYIYGKHTIVITDHKPLLSLLKNKELEGILQRYQMAIMEYDLTIQYVKGSDNKVADYLSREDFLSIDIKEEVLKDVFPEMKTPYDKPYIVENMSKYLDDKEKEQYKDGIAKTKAGDRFYVPIVLREKLLHRFHNAATLGNHMSYGKIAIKFKEVFFWKSMDKDMLKIWSSCEMCEINKDHAKRLVQTAKRQIPILPGNWTVINADYMQVNDEYILVIIDEFSKFVYAVVTKNQSGPTTRLHLHRCFTTLGFPQILKTDNGPAFISKIVKDYTKSVGVEQHYSSPYHHRGNAIVERFNKTLREAIRIQRQIKGANSKARLSDIVYQFVYTYNRSKHLKTGIEPAKLLLNTGDSFISSAPIHNGYTGIIPLYQSLHKNVKREQIRRHGTEINVGDKVLKKVMFRKDAKTSHKNQPTWEGPYRVLQCLYGDTYEI
uniref:RNA-directed DNA polymerase n=1 Tax=Strongyloides papillosus TaxID=174720 RepID=A0A0N5CC24_STREA